MGQCHIQHQLLWHSPLKYPLKVLGEKSSFIGYFHSGAWIHKPEMWSYAVVQLGIICQANISSVVVPCTNDNCKSVQNTFIYQALLNNSTIKNSAPPLSCLKAENSNSNFATTTNLKFKQILTFYNANFFKAGSKTGFITSSHYQLCARVVVKWRLTAVGKFGSF